MEAKTRRRVRDPAATRETILDAACHLLAKDGLEGVSLSAVAHLASVNRGTAYQHFETREKLIEATIQWVSDKMFRAVFGDPSTAGQRRVEEVDVASLTERLSRFAMDNPEICRVWLQQVLASAEPSQDPFWREYYGSLKRFSQTDLAEPDIDAEVMAVINLAGVFFWPVLARAHAADDDQRSALAGRYTHEILRLSMYGTMRAHAFPDVAKRLNAAESEVKQD